MRGSHLPHAEFSLQYLKFSLRYAMSNMSGMFSFAFWVFSTQKCEAVNLPKFELACMPARTLGYLGMPFLIIAHALCTCMHNMHAHHDVTRVAYDANHVTMTSPVFTFHLCYVGMRWHDVISVNVS